MKFRITLLLVIVVLMLSVLACGTSSNQGVKVDTPTPTDQKVENAPAAETDKEPTTAPVAEKPSTFKVGDLVEVKGHTIMLNGVSVQGTTLTATFTVMNNGSDEINVSSMLSFSVKDLEGTKLEQAFMDCGTGLDGKVLTGDRLKGDVCWEGAKKDTSYKIYYESNFLSSGAVVWEITPEDFGKVVDAPTGGSSPTVETFKVGDLVELKGHTITLNSAEITGNKVVANFSINNNGNEELAVSSMVSFYAKDISGTKLEQELFDCGSSLDGKVLAGDKLKGDICWKVQADKNIKLYYEASFLGSGAVVWDLAE